MPYKDATTRRETIAKSVRGLRAYRRAVADGHPKALEAERQRDLAEHPLRPVYELEAKLKPLPKAERQAYRAEHESLRARCLAIDTKKARAAYLRLRKEVIAEYEVFT